MNRAVDVQQPSVRLEWWNEKKGADIREHFRDDVLIAFTDSRFEILSEGKVVVGVKQHVSIVELVTCCDFIQTILT